MSNLLAKSVQLHRKRHKIQKKLVYPKGSTLYLLRNERRLDKFTRLATVEYFGIEFDNFRNSPKFEIAYVPETEFLGADLETRTLADIVKIFTHIAILTDNSTEIYSAEDRDEIQPFHLSFYYQLYGKLTQQTDRDWEF